MRKKRPEEGLQYFNWVAGESVIKTERPRRTRISDLPRFAGRIWNFITSYILVRISPDVVHFIGEAKEDK